MIRCWIFLDVHCIENPLIKWHGYGNGRNRYTLQTCVYIQRFVQSDIKPAHLSLNSQCNVQINIQAFILNLANCIHDLIEDIVCLFFPMRVCIHVQCVRIHNVVWEEEIGRRGEIGSSGEKKV